MQKFSFYCLGAYVVFFLLHGKLFQSAAMVAVTNVAEYLDETAIRRMILPKTKVIYEKNQSDLKIVSNVLSCVERTLDRLDKSQIIDEVLPLLYDIRLSDPQITLRVVSEYILNVILSNYEENEL